MRHTLLSHLGVVLHLAIVVGAFAAILTGCASSPSTVSEEVIPLGRQYTPLIEATHQSDMARVEVLVKSGVDVNKKNEFGWDALFFAIDALRPDIAVFLLKNGADARSREPPGRSPSWRRAPASTTSLSGSTILMAAVARDFPDVVKELIARHADVAARNYYGENALRFARSPEVAQLSIDQGLNPNTTVGTGQKNDFSIIGSNTVLIIAAQEGRVALMDVLLQTGADPNARGVLGATAMHFAAEFNQVESIRRLLATGKVDINVSNGSDTPLHWAVMHRRIGTVKFLLDAGADVAIRQKTNFRRTALEIANVYDAVEITNLIKQHIATLGVVKK